MYLSYRVRALALSQRPAKPVSIVCDILHPSMRFYIQTQTIKTIRALELPMGWNFLFGRPNTCHEKYQEPLIQYICNASQGYQISGRWITALLRCTKEPEEPLKIPRPLNNFLETLVCPLPSLEAMALWVHKTAVQAPTTRPQHVQLAFPLCRTSSNEHTGKHRRSSLTHNSPTVPQDSRFYDGIVSKTRPHFTLLYKTA